MVENPSPRGGGNAFALTCREVEVIRRAREGATDKEIADALDMTVASLRTLWNTVRDKLGAVNRTHAIALAVVERAEAPEIDLRERLARTLTQGRVSTWVWQSKTQQALFDREGRELFHFGADGPVKLSSLLAHVWAPDRSRFERYLMQCGDLRPMTPIELRVGTPGDYRQLVRTTNLAACEGSEPTLLLASTALHTFAAGA